MNTILTPETVSLFITVVLIPFMGKAISIGAKALEHKINNDKYNKYIDLAEGAIESSVVSVGNTFVDSLKKSGNFTQVEQEEAFAQAKVKVLSILGNTTKQELTNIFGDLNAYIDNRIEFYVKHNK